MEKVTITLTFEKEQLDALEHFLKKENTTVQKRMDETLKQLYEKSVPEAVREYLESRSAPAARPRRPPRSGKPVPDRTEKDGEATSQFVETHE